MTAAKPKWESELEAANELAEMSPHPSEKAIIGCPAKEYVKKVYGYGVPPNRADMAEILLYVLTEPIEFELREGGEDTFKFLVENGVLGITYGFKTWNDAHFYAKCNSQRYRAIDRVMGD